MHRRWFFLLALLLPLVSWPYALARPVLTGHAVTTVGDIGEHYPLFIVTKSHHPENLTVVYTKLDQHCRVLPDRDHGGQPTLDFYWLMDHTRYKPMAALLKDGIGQRLQFTDTRRYQEDPTTFAVRLDELSRLQHDLPQPTVQIKTDRPGGGCVGR